MSDITIHGAGIFGLSIAWACLERGARVRVIDPYGPGAGASGGIVGALAPHVPENWNDKKAFQLESLLMAEAFWAGVAQAGGLSAGYARTGRLQPLADAAALELARDRGRGAGALWLGLAEWNVAEADVFGWAPASPTGFVIHDTLTARVHPKQACAALVAAICARGGEVVREGKECGQVIHATGTAGLEALNAGAARQVGMGIKGQAALLEFAAPDLPQLFAGGVHIVPHADGTVAVGSTSERDYTSGTDTDAQLDDVIAAARAAVPALADAPVIARWAGVRPRTRSRAPMLGPHPLYAGQFIANGGFKIGFGMAPKVAEVMADLVLEGRDGVPEGFRPEASLKNLALGTTGSAHDR
ncbi:FAD-binding oxidoreductase [Roseovarius sp. LXJ103]|uniref:NAD(P)/FAD-dependent oxidoreductase n=1 Tax=Roseovarius carneus TaxID=2853164 RepID=UPI000D60A0E2|nr:FAD-binding oxidoreductase [Roseovarius carneus]MBZ8117703.1 FAD-binding oxidoreductase [Roseovarius carneus]PWE36523.1 FAD-dependent oxidoreductase [Pelagicola sp. LXJ1103]